MANMSSIQDKLVTMKATPQTTKTAQPLANQAEIKRKAENGILLASPNAESQALYDSYKSAVNTQVKPVTQLTPAQALDAEVKRKALAGIPLTNPTSDVATLYDKYAGQGQMDSILAQLKLMGDASYDGQKAEIDAQRKLRLGELEASFNEAVQNGEMSVREAKEAFAAQSAAIDQQKYEDTQVTNVMSSARGIGNSQQLLGMQAGDNARANANKTTAQSAMNSSISSIRERLNAIKLNKDIEANRVNTEFDMALGTARSQRDMQIAQGTFDLKRDDYNATREFSNQKQMLQLETKAQEQLMVKQSGLNIQEMKAKLGIDKELGKYMSDLELVQMAKAHGYDLQKMKASFGYDSALQSAQLAAQASEGAKNRAAQAAEGRANRSASAKAKDDGYAVALQRELNKYKEGTDEWKIVQAQIAQETKRKQDDALLGLQTDIAIDKAIKNKNFDITNMTWSQVVAASNAAGVTPPAKSSIPKASGGSGGGGYNLSGIDWTTGKPRE